tara:strand:+ start:123 stop:1250 length:1128 start_codon:yes stop_codon:yes gene_type:complete
MKLFKSLLVAPATLGLLAPMSATANEVTISDFSPAEQIAVTNSRVDGLEARLNNIEAGSFSETTTASFSADFAIGAVDGMGISTGVTDGQEALEAYYSFQIDLSTSFTGEDSLDVSIDAGNSGGAATEFDLNGTSDDLQVDGVSYTFPLGEKVTAFVGDNTDGSLLYSTACVYGGPSNTLDDCGAATAPLGAGGGTAAGASFDIGNGFTAAVGYTGAGSSTSGLLTKEGDDAYGGQLTYTADSYGASVTYALNEASGVDTTYWALNGYWTPSDSGSMPSISVGYEVGNPETAGAKDTIQYFAGLQWDEAGPGTFGVAFGTDGAFAEDATEYMMYEAFYSYPVNDSMTVTPLVYVREKATGTEDQTGVMVKTSFSF